MRKFILALILATMLTLTIATPVLAGEPPDYKPIPDESIPGLVMACAAHGLNQASLYKPNPAFPYGYSVKVMIESVLLGLGTPPALGRWK